MSKPVGLSKRSAGPPPGDLHARSVTAAISRSGLTGSAMRASRRLRSRSARNSLRSEYINKASHEGTKTRKHENTKTRKHEEEGLAFRVFVFSWLRFRRHSIGYPLRQRERAAAVFAGHRRRTLRDDRVHEITQLARERFFLHDLDLATLNG